MSCKEKFNVIANELASQELRETNIEELMNHSRNGPIKEISGRMITSILAKELRKAAEIKESRIG